MNTTLAPTNGKHHAYAQMPDEELARLIFRDEVIRQACEFMALMILSRRRDGVTDVVCEVSVQGRQVNATIAREKFGTYVCKRLESG